jgi:hypothetical protein
MFASKDLFLTRPSGGGYTISRSVRLRSSASAYLNRTPASATNQKTWTWSSWIKRGKLGVFQMLFSLVMARGLGLIPLQFSINFPANDTLRIQGNQTAILKCNPSIPRPFCLVSHSCGCRCYSSHSKQSNYCVCKWSTSYIIFYK